MGVVADFLWGLLPDFNTTAGFIVYSAAVYACLMFMGWLANPALEESYQKEMRLEEASRKGRAMRAKNKAL